MFDLCSDPICNLERNRLGGGAVVIHGKIVTLSRPIHFLDALVIIVGPLGRNRHRNVAYVFMPKLHASKNYVMRFQHIRLR